MYGRSIVTWSMYRWNRPQKSPSMNTYILFLAIQLVSLAAETFQYSRLLLRNETIIERANHWRAVYLWADESRKYFNPFDRVP